jgi:glucose-6-phosphate isomerase
MAETRAMTGMAGGGPVTTRAAWKALAAHHRQIRDVHLRERFAADPRRGERVNVAEGRASLRIAQAIADELAKFREQVRRGQATLPATR